ncbi:MAG: cation-translocating P-type ATPase [Burkholderiales bacterium]|nr:cation-translocating P-type ATPase [Burkholderiales bacterium]
MTVDAVAATLHASPAAGLAPAEAARRLADAGPNRLPEARSRGAAAMLLAQFTDFMIVVLLVAALVSALVGEIADAAVILVIVLLNGLIGFVQEARAERAMAALRAMAAPHANVLRDGSVLTIPAADLVPGDLVLLEAGARVPADLRLTASASLAISEAALTGESAPVAKTTGVVPDPATPVADRCNLAFSGTLVTYGRGAGLVVATGSATELGRIAGLLGAAGVVRTPLQIRLALFGRRLAHAVLAVCALIFVAGLLRGEPALLMFMTAVSLAVAAIPEALPAVVVIALALGARRLARQQALVRQLPAVETLGSVTVICADKTGTLTQNRMRVDAYWVHGARADAGGDPGAAGRRSGAWPDVLRAMVLVNDAVLAADGGIAGEPTEAALLEAARGAGLDWRAMTAAAPRVGELPFDSERKRMATLHRMGNAVVSFVKGAPETVLPRCAAQAGAAGPEAFDAATAAAAAAAMAADGLRVLALAMRSFEAVPASSAAAEEGLTFLGLVGLIDPPRPEAADAVAQCRSAGIAPVMITGDHPATARTVAARLGILRDGDRLVTGAELAAMDEAALARRIGDARVFARVDPEQKIRIVGALQARGECVAMTGDGVNDAPALRRADIGVAMGRGGTDVAREAAAMVLLDDNFATIVHAVREGRRIFDNIRKFIRYAMTGNAGEIWTIFAAPFLGMPIPLLPIHILWINLVTDGLPGLALAIEPAERGVMHRPPRPVRQNIFAGGMWQQILWGGLLLGGVALAGQAWALAHGAHAQTMVFTVLALGQLALVLALRSETESLLAIGLLSNRPLAFTVAGSVALQMALVYVPALNTVFHTAPLAPEELAVCLGLASVVLLAVEGEKRWRRRARAHRSAT